MYPEDHALAQAKWDIATGTEQPDRTGPLQTIDRCKALLDELREIELASTEAPS
jgi:hypothetical protein